MQERFVARVGKFLVELPQNRNSLFPRPRGNQRASLFQNFVDIQRFGLQVQLPGIGDRKRKQSLNHARELFQFVIKDGKCFLVFLCRARLGKQKLRFAV